MAANNTNRAVGFTILWLVLAIVFASVASEMRMPPGGVFLLAVACPSILVLILASLTKKTATEIMPTPVPAAATAPSSSSRSQSFPSQGMPSIRRKGEAVGLHACIYRTATRACLIVVGGWIVVTLVSELFSPLQTCLRITENRSAAWCVDRT